MYKKIIVGLSLDHGISQTALEAARQLIDDNGEIVAVHVYEPPHSSVSTYLSEEDVNSGYQVAKKNLAERIGHAKDVQQVMLRGHSGRAITDHAKEIKADCIVVGSHKPGLQDYFLGSTASRVVRHAPCSVHVLR
ncbi:MAG: universal stress protein [Rhizobiales bacterium]|nr:universal stress protein [Hyphomicrobiales bacterium]